MGGPRPDHTAGPPAASLGWGTEGKEAGFGFREAGLPSTIFCRWRSACRLAGAVLWDSPVTPVHRGPHTQGRGVSGLTGQSRLHSVFVVLYSHSKTIYTWSEGQQVQPTEISHQCQGRAACPAATQPTPGSISACRQLCQMPLIALCLYSFRCSQLGRRRASASVSCGVCP